MFATVIIGSNTPSQHLCRGLLQRSVRDNLAWIVTRNTANQSAREARFLKKMIVGKKRKKSFSVDQAVTRTLAEISQIGKSGIRGAPLKSNKTLRRVDVLNRLFMEHISSLMATGDVTPELMGLGITISQVKISSDFSKVNVYWVASGTEKDLTIEPLLQKAGFALRYALTQLRVIGMVPPIEFVKDKTFSKIVEVQTLLEKCDFGEDFVPTSPRNYFSPSKSINSSLNMSDSTAEDLHSEDSSVEECNDVLKKAETEADLYSLQLMKQDILGVRHDIISAEIKEVVSKSSRWKSNKQSPQSTVSVSSVEHVDKALNEEPTPIISAAIAREQDKADEKRRQDFMQYLKQRSILRDKELKRNSTAEKERDFYDNEAFERWKQSVDFQFPEDLDENDNDYDFEEEYKEQI